MLLLKNKKALITGGTNGIGKAIALLFAEQGADVAIFGTHEGRAKEVIAELETLRQLPTQQWSYSLVDVSQTKAIETEVQSLLAQWGHIDILVNNAGITRDNLLLRMSEADWDSVMAVNLKSVYNTCRVLTRPMMRARKGKIINIASVVGLAGNAGQANYSAAKAGMVGFTKSLALELASRNILVNCIAPGYIQTQMTSELSEATRAAILEKIPLARVGQPKEVAQAVLFLASDLADYITGQVITVDGGMVT